MTSSTPQHARTGALVRGWRAFRMWRRTRPFWGGLFTILSGLEIFATTQGSLGGLSFQMGPTGFLSWLIPTILVACGLLMWGTPAQRMFYAIVAAMTAVFSLIGVNLGGFLVGLLLGMVGSALGFAWTPIAPPEPPRSAPPSRMPRNSRSRPRRPQWTRCWTGPWCRRSASTGTSPMWTSPARSPPSGPARDGPSCTRSRSCC
ncbi:DUF6114 domain-containing protein [Phytohabitans flavus]|uniref:DUF6114 domain-containing protein n=1 Tax=Phytohabitans flavus TaxID=1076124 RepID=UPI0036381FED